MSKGEATAGIGIAGCLICIGIACLAVWPFNLYKLIKCDWTNDNWKPEIVHGIGVVLPPASYVTVWFGTDAKEE